jgi:hypothetical protein
MAAPPDAFVMGTKRLYGDEAIVLEVAREVDCRHAALTELALESVAISQARCRTARRIRHDDRRPEQMTFRAYSEDGAGSDR